MNEPFHFTVDKKANKEIIDDLFEDESKIPISDVSALLEH